MQLSWLHCGMNISMTAWHAHQSEISIFFILKFIYSLLQRFTKVNTELVIIITIGTVQNDYLQ
jgi:hypothetical protein